MYALQLTGVDVDPFTRPRGSGALLVCAGGRVVLSVEGRGRRIAIRPGEEPALVSAAVGALVAHLTAGSGVGRAPDIMVETINREPAGASAYAEMLRDAGFRREGLGVRYR